MSRFSYTVSMKPPPAPDHLDVSAFALGAGQAAGELLLSGLHRVAIACAPDEPLGEVVWAAQGQTRLGGKGEQELWLHLNADCTVPMICQRCLGTVYTRLLVDRWFRFVADEKTAAAQDDGCDEDLLVNDGAFRLEVLIEDELVLELPHIARHGVCPVHGVAARPESAPTEERAHPFAALAGFKPR